MSGRALLVASLALGSAALAADPAWPPPPETQVRIEALRQKIGDASATPAERQAARQELVRLLMNPTAPASPLPPMPARAAVDPVSSPQMPASPMPATPPVSSVAPPVMPAPPVVDPRGGILVPAGKSVVDPRTGAVLIDTGNGWLDPATGRFVPKN